MAQEAVQTAGNETQSIEVSHSEAALSPPDRPRRRNRTQGSPPATAKRQRPSLGRGPHGTKIEQTAEELAKAELSRTLITKYSGLVRQIAGGFQRKLPRNVLRDDLIAAGMSGLWDAVRKHGHEQTENFDWYVRVRIRGAILDELRAQDWLPRRARAAAAEAAATSGGAAPSAPVVLRFDDVSETEQARCLTATQTPTGEQHLVEQHTR